MGLRYPRGGILPDDYGLSLTVYCEDATEANPVVPGTPLVFSSTAGEYGVKKAADGDEPEAFAKVTVQKPNEPLSVHVASKYVRNIKIAYVGALAVGDSVVAAPDGKYKKATAKNSNLVVKVNDANKTAEVLI